MKDRDNHFSRRNFLGAAGMTSASLAVAGLGSGALAAPSPKSVKPRIIGANDRIHYGVIGVGGMGAAHVRFLRGSPQEAATLEGQNIALIGASDVFDKRRQYAEKVGGVPGTQVHSDYRRLLDNKDIDVVVIATPDHQHAKIAIDALEAGKHIYVEKPMTRTLAEAFKLYDVAKRTGCMVQVGAQGCSNPKWLKTRELVKADRIGKPLWAQASYCRNARKGEWNYNIDPEASSQSVDWNAWLGGAPKRDWSPERFFRWRKYWDYGTGIIGDLWPHRLNPLMLAMALDEFPKTVSCIGNQCGNRDGGNGELREVADTTMLMVEFPSGAMIVLVGSTVNERGLEDVIHGERANLLFGGGKVQLNPERPYADEIDSADETPPDAGDGHVKHHLNFIHALRTNTKPNADIELSVQVQTVLSLAEMSYRKGKTIHFDAAKRRSFI